MNLIKWSLFESAVGLVAESDDGRQESCQNDHCPACALARIVAEYEDADVNLRGLHRYGSCYQTLALFVREKRVSAKQNPLARRKANLAVSPRRVCIDCTHFWYIPGSSEYSEETPGYDSRMECVRGHWDKSDICDDSTTAMLFDKATTCDDFSQTEFSKQRYGEL